MSAIGSVSCECWLSDSASEQIRLLLEVLGDTDVVLIARC
jgi:hypothetical protein